MFNIEEFSHKMQESLDVFIKYTKGLSVGTANVSLIENVKVKAYDNYMHLYELATISIGDSSTLIVSPFDKSLIGEIEKAISIYNANFIPANRNSQVYVSIPKLTEEVRKDTVKIVKHEAEQTKTKVRNIRRNTMNEIKLLEKNGLSEDLQEDYKKKIDQITHEYNEKIDTVCQNKAKEIMKI